MKPVKKYFNLIVLQWAIWVLVFLLMFVSMLQYDTWPQALTYTGVQAGVYLLIIYAHAGWMIPALYRSGFYFTYALWVVLLLAFAVFMRTLVMLLVYNAWFAKGRPEAFRTAMLPPAIFSILLVFIVSIIFRLALDYFKLSKAQESMKAEKAQAELGLLKQQLQPHFLFNTLNNIYYVAQKESPASADLIERLSGILRYFIEESPKPQVPLKNEIDLLSSYMELERIRVRNAVDIDFTVSGVTANTTMPPLLLMPVVENIFKHGIDKRSTENKINITLEQKNGFLYFKTQNKQQPAQQQHTTGTGLNNLQQRLRLYYGGNFEFSAAAVNGFFITQMKIPVYEY
jgi:sensor histidine kinase YesM